MNAPPVSWCRIFQVGPACPKLCEGCRETNARLTPERRRALAESKHERVPVTESGGES